MNIGISKLFEDAESLADQQRLLPAIQTLEEARRLTKIPDRLAWATYNLGAIHWHFLGNGLAARREFLTCINEFDTHGYGQHPGFIVMHANALENAMLCALSFDEFDNFATRLHALKPEVPILTGLVPEVREGFERGESWSDRLFSFAGSYYNRNNPKRDVGRYGEAKSTYHLILANRRELRISHEDWRMAIYEYCALSMRMVSDCMTVRGGDNDPHSPEEYISILTEAIPFADEYLMLNQGDDDLQKVRRDMEEIVDNCRKRWASRSERIILSPKTYHQICRNCGTVFDSKEVDHSEAITWMMNTHDRSTICPNCGGDVVWKSNSELMQKMGCGCIIILLILGIFVGYFIFWLK
ncbi:hypothetical protein ACFL6H_06335 [Candidatus Latescibacterota bacterium]